jgi:hypothetical protein
MRRLDRLALLSTLLVVPALGRAQATAGKPYLPVGLFFGRVEEGARIFTPARLLPLAHPEALGHDFPTVLQLHGTEFSALLWLGNQVGLRLWATLQRYPREPSGDWPYAEFRQPPDTTKLGGAHIIHRPKAEAPLPGLRGVLYDGSALILFIVDTRSLTLTERAMATPTTMGLDIRRAAFLAKLDSAGRLEPHQGLHAVIFDP